MRLLFALVALCVALAPAAHGQRVTVRAEVESRAVAPDGVVNYAVVVAGEGTALVPTPDAPPTTGLAAVDPYPTTQADVRIVDGAAQQSVVFRWAYRPVRSGRALIGPTVVRVGDRTFRTSPVEIEVGAGLNAPAPPSRGGPRDDRTARDDVFVRATPSQTSAWQGEQVVVDYTLFFDPSLVFHDLRQLGSWDTDGFWREEIPLEKDRHPSLVEVGGRRYARLVIKRVALFATRSGTLTVSPFEVGGQALVPPGTAAGGSVRLHTREIRVQAAAPALTLTVRPLPPGAPPSFGGAVGAFRLDVARGPMARATGEATTLTATVAGDGNLATLATPALALPPSLDLYPPRADLRVARGGARVAGEKTFTYTVVPLRAGAHRVPPVVFTYFDPESGQYRTLADGATTLTAQGPDVATSRPDTARAALLPPRTDVGEEAASERPLHTRAWPYAVLLAPLLALGGIAGTRRARSHRPAERHRDDALDALAAARAAVGAPGGAAFYEALARALEDAAASALGRSVRGLTRLTLDARLRAHGAAGADADALAQLLLRADLARFAGILPDAAQRHADLAAAAALLRRLAPAAAVAETPASARHPLVALVLVALAFVPAVRAQDAALPARFAAALSASDMGELRRLAAASSDPAVLHALGTVAARQRQTALAVWALERSRLLDRADTAAAYNLGIVRRTAGLDSLALPRGDLAPTLWTAAVRALGAEAFFAAGALLWWAAAAVVLMRLLRRLPDVWTRRALVLLVPAAAALLGLAAAASLGAGLRREAVATAATAVLGDASEDGPVVTRLPPGALVELHGGGAGAWARVRTGEGREGYVRASALVPTDQPDPP